MSLHSLWFISRQGDALFRVRLLFLQGYPKMRSKVLWILPLLLLFPLPLQTAPSRLLGDLDGDLRITPLDVLLALRIVAGKVTPTPAQLQSGDVSPVPGQGGRTFGDGRITLQDARHIMRFLIGLEPTPWPGGPPFRGTGTSPANFTFPASSPLLLSTGTGFQVRGSIRDQQGNPLPNITVNFFEGIQSLTVNTQTDAQGRFQVILSPGTHQISLATTFTDGGVTTTVAQINIMRVSLTQDRRLDLQRPPLPNLVTVTGGLTLLDARFRPQFLTFVNLSHRFNVLQPVTISTSPILNLRYQVRVPPGVYNVVVQGTVPSRIGLASEVSILLPTTVQVGNIPFERPLSVPVLFSLVGMVQSTTGEPLSSGQVLALPTQPVVLGSLGKAVIEQGRFELFLPIDTYNFFIAPENPDAPFKRLWFWEQSVFRGNRNSNVVLTDFPPSMRFRGAVVDSLGRPASGVQVVATSLNLPASPRWQIQGQAVTMRDGSFSLFLPPGTYQVNVVVPGSSSFVIPLGFPRF